MKLAATLAAALLATAGSTAAIANDTKPAKPAKPAAERAAPQEAGRNWSAIDTNKDGLVSPEEMESYLKANPGPLKGK